MKKNMGKIQIIKKFHGGSMAETYLINKDNNKYVRKVINDTSKLGIDKLKKQLDWIMNLEDDIKNIFPKIIDYKFTNNYGYYDMKFYSMTTLKDHIIESQTIDENIENIISNFVKLGRDISNKTYNINNNDYIKTKHINKMFNRCNKVVNENNIFKQFFNSEKIIINEKEYLNFNPLMSKILTDNNFINYLSPKIFHRSHGDFTLQNILIDNNTFIVIDPRGEEYDSLYYDLSKLYQSCHSKYDLLYNGNYKCFYSVDDVNINFKIINNVELFDKLFVLIKENINKFYNLDENWDLIARFYEASHLIAMTPFRYKENLEKTLLCYATGIKIMNEVVKEWENK